MFLALETQWRVVVLAEGVLRVLGLRYEALTGALWRSCTVAKKRRPAVMAGLRMMEREVLRVAEARR